MLSPPEAEELELIVDFGHFRVLLCEKCTWHRGCVGTENTGNPRIFVTWEVLEFPQGARFH